jgi:hypothetical protein
MSAAASSLDTTALPVQETEYVRLVSTQQTTINQYSMVVPLGVGEPSALTLKKYLHFKQRAYLYIYS